MGIQDDLYETSNSFWGKVDGWIVAIVTAATAISALLGAFVTWRYDRRRLTLTEEEIMKIKSEIKENEEKTEQSFSNMRAAHDASTEKVLDKIDELKFFLMHKNISEKGKRDDEADKR
jgi:uncharacterized membrane protein